MSTPSLSKQSDRVRRVWHARGILRGSVLLCTALSLFACQAADTPLSQQLASDDVAMANTPGSSLEQQLAALRSLTAPYHRFEAAQLAGYTVPVTPCRQNPPVGAMGDHFLNPAYVDGTVEVLKPEVVVYEPRKNGERRFVAVEYIIPFSILPATATPPTLFGEEFLQNFGDQVWMQHVWIGRHNHDGMFATWNPNVSCQFATP